jgi:hypothetical protein
MEEHAGAQHGESDVDRRDQSLMKEFGAPGICKGRADHAHQEQKDFEVRFDLLVQERTDQDNYKNQREANG